MQHTAAISCIQCSALVNPSMLRKLKYRQIFENTRFVSSDIRRDFFRNSSACFYTSYFLMSTTTFPRQARRVRRKLLGQVNGAEEAARRTAEDDESMSRRVLQNDERRGAQVWSFGAVCLNNDHLVPLPHTFCIVAPPRPLADLFSWIHPCFDYGGLSAKHLIKIPGSSDVWRAALYFNKSKGQGR